VNNQSLTLSPERTTRKPYKIKGLWYYPQAHYEYSETGIASWYGPGFHKKKTANGEIFDQNIPSAAHKTLPLPSVVVVTNLDNGRMLKVRVNDRGPFVHGRIIDLSKRAAELLGLHQTGTAKVKVETLVAESIALASLAASRTPVTEIKVSAVLRDNVEKKSLMPASSLLPKLRNSPSISVSSSPCKDPADSELMMDHSGITSLPHAIYIRLGAYAHATDAYKLQYSLKKYSSSRIQQVTEGARKVHKLELGPLPNVAKADAILDELIAKGYTDAKIVVE